MERVAKEERSTAEQDRSTPRALNLFSSEISDDRVVSSSWSPLLVCRYVPVVVVVLYDYYATWTRLWWRPIVLLLLYHYKYQSKSLSQSLRFNDPQDAAAAAATTC